MSAIEVVDPDVEDLKTSIREALKQEPRTDGNAVFCPVCERGFDPRGIAPHMDKHRRDIGDLAPRGKRGPNKKPKKMGVVVITPAAPEPLLVLRQQIKDRIARIGELEHAAGIAEEYGPGEIARLQAKRHGLGIALNLLDGL